MAELPFVDVHEVPVRAPREVVWGALIGALGDELGRHSAFARVLGCDPATRSRDFAGEVGQTIPGFRVAQSEPGHRLALTGRHRFSRYRLTFVITDGALRAETHAAFPGVHGRFYRAAVISSGAHVLLTRRMLRGIAAHAQRLGAPAESDS